MSIQLLSGGSAHPGRLLAAPGGKRLFYGQISNDCIFIGADLSPAYVGNLGKIFSQGRGAFSNDISFGGPANLLSTGLAGTKAVISNFLDVFVGAVACAGGPVAWGITGMTLAVTAGNIKKNYKTYSDGLEAIYYYMIYCSTLTPTLTKFLLGPLIFDAIWDKAKAKGLSKLTGAVPGPDIGGYLLGVGLDALGEKQVETRLKAISKLMKDVLVKVALHQQEHYTETLSNEQVHLLAKHHIVNELSPIGLAPKQADAETIIREVAANCFKVRKPLSDIAKTLDLL